MHDQRHRRARRQHFSRRSGDGAAHAQELSRSRYQYHQRAALSEFASGLAGHGNSDSDQQADRRRQRFRPRGRYSSGRRAQAQADLRDHDAGIDRDSGQSSGHGQALRTARFRRAAQTLGIQFEQGGHESRLFALQGARGQEEKRVRRGHRSDRRRRDFAHAGPPGQVRAALHERQFELGRHTGGDGKNARRWGGDHRSRLGGRRCRCLLSGDYKDHRLAVATGALFGQRDHRWHGRPGRSFLRDRRRRHSRLGPGIAHRHDHGERFGVYQRAQQTGRKKHYRQVVAKEGP